MVDVGRGSDKEINGQEVQMALWLAVQELKKESEVKSGVIEKLKAEKDADIRKLEEENEELKQAVCEVNPQAHVCMGVSEI
jgi:hypothetical protein